MTASTPYGSEAWEHENRVLAVFGVPTRDVTLDTDEVADKIQWRLPKRGAPWSSAEMTREQVVAALERLADQNVIYRIGDGRVTAWRLLGNTWEATGEEPTEADFGAGVSDETPEGS